MKNEQWMPIVMTGFTGLYEVSDAGQVRSLDRVINRKDGSSEFKLGRVLKPAKSASGYCFIALANQGRRKLIVVHRLVATAFIGQSNGKHVNHIDFDKTNNAVENLEWVSPKENTAHSINSGRWEKLHKNKMILASRNPKRATKLTSDDVSAIRSACASGEYQHEIAKRYGIIQSTVSKIKRGAIWSDEVRHGVHIKTACQGVPA